MSEPAVSYDFEQLEPSEPPPRDAAARAIAQARVEADVIRESARAEGYEAGLAAGRRDGEAQVQTGAAALDEALVAVQALRGELADAVERDAIELALALAGKIVPGSLRARPELVVEVVQGALRRVVGQRTITVLLNPADLEYVRAALGELRAQTGAIDLCDLQGDQRVPIGGAIVRTVEGEVDARLQTQFERAREVIAAELAGGQPA